MISEIKEKINKKKKSYIRLFYNIGICITLIPSLHLTYSDFDNIIVGNILVGVLFFYLLLGFYLGLKYQTPIYTFRRLTIFVFDVEDYKYSLGDYVLNFFLILFILFFGLASLK